MRLLKENEPTSLGGLKALHPTGLKALHLGVLIGLLLRLAWLRECPAHFRDDLRVHAHGTKEVQNEGPK